MQPPCSKCAGNIAISFSLLLERRECNEIASFFVPMRDCGSLGLLDFISFLGKGIITVEVGTPLCVEIVMYCSISNTIKLMDCFVRILCGI